VVVTAAKCAGHVEGHLVTCMIRVCSGRKGRNYISLYTE
jgi:hypothetical protein